MKYNKTVLASILVGAISATFQLTAIAADKVLSKKSLQMEINDCALKELDNERLECFDSIAKALSAEDGGKKLKRSSLPDTLGGGKFEGSRTDQKGSRGLVKSCKKSHDGKWFFIFENGQVWKQVDTDHRRYNECNFNVTIKKDGFGYKMQIDGQTRKIRIRRHR